ncbi:cytochrome P450 [Umezawaea sp.]|uniref:cytochrome P450 n=1 Tax=Umezawaea sp. TaxID=1955258 RepID=UPI002ED522AF
MRGFLDLHGEDFLADPHSALRELREADWRADTAAGTAILRYDEVRTVLSSWSLRTPGTDFLAAQGITDGPLVDAMRGFLLNADGSEHQRLRRAVGRAFTVKRVEEFRSTAGFLADELIEGLGDEFDFVADFAHPFALRALCRFIGVPEDVRREVSSWAADVGLLFGYSVAPHASRIEAALDDLHSFIDDLLDQRRRTPGDDLVSSLVDQSLTEAELRSLVVTLMSAGQGTVQHQLSGGVAAFLEFPDQWRLLASDSSLAGQAAEEVVRFQPASLLGLPRIAKEDIVVNGVVLPAGSCVLPVTGSANRDSAVFSGADRLDVTVGRVAHLTYGGGIHYCLGAALARVELQEALPRLARALPSLRRDGAGEWLPAGEAVYGPVVLPVRR